MGRKKFVRKREILPDPKFNDVVVAKFISSLLKEGKKSTAEAIFYGCVDVVAERTGDDGLKLFKKALENVKPLLEVKSRRVGGATYQVPVTIEGDRRFALAIRWMLAAARARNGKSMAEKLASEMLDASNNTGATVKRREDTHRMADANKAFAHYRF